MPHTWTDMSAATAPTAPVADTHLALGLAESAACEPTDWERWVDAVEALLGHDADGDQTIDGYSLDGFYTAWKSGTTPEQALAETAKAGLR